MSTQPAEPNPAPAAPPPQPQHTLQTALASIQRSAANQQAAQSAAMAYLSDLATTTQNGTGHNPALHTGDRDGRIQLHLAIPPTAAIETLLEEGRASLSDIEGRLASGGFLADPAAPIMLRGKMDEFISAAVTPPLYWGGDPSRQPDYWGRCMVLGTVAGRGFAQLGPSREAIDGEALASLGERVRNLPAELRLAVWEEYFGARGMADWWFAEAIAPVFLRAFFSGRDPEPGARFIAAVVVLTAGASLGWTEGLTAHGKGWSWMDDKVHEPDVRWGVEDVFAAVKGTESTLPRENHNWQLLERQLTQTKVVPEYVPREILDVMDRARKAVDEIERGERKDWSGRDVEEMYEKEWRGFWKEMHALSSAPRPSSSQGYFDDAAGAGSG